jgi:hypothetical protein
MKRKLWQAQEKLKIALEGLSGQIKITYRTPSRGGALVKGSFLDGMFIVLQLVL